LIQLNELKAKREPADILHGKTNTLVCKKIPSQLTIESAGEYARIVLSEKRNNFEESSLPKIRIVRYTKHDTLVEKLYLEFRSVNEALQFFDVNLASFPADMNSSTALEFEFARERWNCNICKECNYSFTHCRKCKTKKPDLDFRSNTLILHNLPVLDESLIKKEFLQHFEKREVDLMNFTLDSERHSCFVSFYFASEVKRVLELQGQKGTKPFQINGTNIVISESGKKANCGSELSMALNVCYASFCLFY
jgi:hypothetical protein